MENAVANQFNLSCPSCHETHSIDICASVWVRLTSDGTDADESQDGSHEWDNRNAAICRGCGWSGNVGGLIDNSEDDHAPECRCFECTGGRCNEPVLKAAQP